MLEFLDQTETWITTAVSPPPMDRRFEQNSQTLASVLWGGEFKNFFPRTGEIFSYWEFFSYKLLFVCVFLYWVRPLVMLLTFAASVFRVGVHSIGCALLAPHQTLTSVPERKVKKISLRSFLVCALRAFHQTLASVLWEGTQRQYLGRGGLYCNQCYFISRTGEGT